MGPAIQAYNLVKDIKRHKGKKTKLLHEENVSEEIKKMAETALSNINKKKKTKNNRKGLKIPSMMQEMTEKGKKRAADYRRKKRVEGWRKNASKEDKRLHEQNRLDQESAIERQNSYRKSYGDWLKD